MQREVIELQDWAVSELVRVSLSQREVTFRAPTGSGKTHMMADFMNRILETDNKVVFIVSSLSKGDLAGQNYKKFIDYKHKGEFSSIDAYLINTDVKGEETPFIPTDHNVYVLPRDLYKKGGLLMRGVMGNFISSIRFKDIIHPDRKIYLIKDECHIETSNLNNIADENFERIINMSATPKLERGQIPDVQITDKEAEDVNLIKRVTMGDESDTVEDALNEFRKIKQQYINILGVKPCLIIQISNKEKADEEWNGMILPLLSNVSNQSLKWMYIVDKPKDCRTNDDVGKKLPVDKWKEYAKGDNGIDVIIFKMFISEGWDIPRACMLYQVRDSKSKQLDEQVVGRVRRNPRLEDFEDLSLEARTLAMNAWVWGVVDGDVRVSYPVKRKGTKNEFTERLVLKSVTLNPVGSNSGFDVNEFLEDKPKGGSSIFSVYRKFLNADDDVRRLGIDYAGNDFVKWYHFASHVESVQKEFSRIICDYDENMVLTIDDDGKEHLITVPEESFMYSSEYYKRIRDWFWKRVDDKKNFFFDSFAEKEWASLIIENSDVVEEFEGVGDGKVSLFGKNFLPNSEIRYPYYDCGSRFSYPDFVMKDRKGRVHLFEVKSLNESGSIHIDREEYLRKIVSLEDAYRRASELTGHLFHIPVLDGDSWKITSFMDGVKSEYDEDSFLEMLFSR